MSAVVKRGRPRSEDLDAAILDATIEELVEHGYSGLSMEAVAQRAGVAKTTVYRRWPDSSHLVVAALTRIKGDVVEPPPGPVRDQLVWLLERMRLVWINPRYASVMRRIVADGVARPQTYTDGRRRLIAPQIAVLRAVLERGVVEGLIRDDIDLDWVRQLLVGPVTSSILTIDSDLSAAQVETSVDVVLRGLAP